MANQYSADVPKGFNVPKQVRLDSITGIQNEETLKDLGAGNSLAFKYYEGLKVYCKDEKTEYIWREVEGVETGLLDTHFVYPTYSAVDGIDYSGKSFNFFLISNNTEPADGSETKLIEGANVTITGTGTTLDPYEISSTIEATETFIEEGDNITITGTGVELNPFIVNADLTDLGIVKTVGNEVIAPGQTLAIINDELTGKVLTTKEYVESVIPSTPDGSETKINAGENVTVAGTGTVANPYIINSIVIEKEITSSTLIITEDEVSVNIEIPETPSFGYLKSFYVNSNYVPTVDSPSDGSVIRPYISYDEAKSAFIGTGTITVPQYIGAVIILQTSSTTAINPTVNNLTIKFENNSILTYTGTDLYMFDTEILYPLIPKSSPRNNLTIPLRIDITGEGQMTRTGGIGLIRGMGSNRGGVAIAGDYDSQIVIRGEINLIERREYPPEVWDGDITDALDVPLEDSYGTPHKYSLTLLPTTPLVYAEYQGYSYGFGVDTGGLLTFSTLVNTAIKAKNTTVIAENLNFLVEGRYIATSSATKMVGFPTYYQPQPNRNMIELDNASLYIYDTLKVADQGGYTTTGVENFFKNINNSEYTGNIDIFSNYYIGTFLNLSDISNTNASFNLSNTYDGSKIQTTGNYFINTPLSPFSLTMLNSNISGFTNKTTSPITLNINTAGTLSSFLGTPVISNIASYANDGAAAAAGLVANSLYFNTTNNALDLV